MVLTALCQAIALSMLVLCWEYSQQLLLSLGCASLTAALAARLLSLSPPWQLLNSILPIAMASSFIVNIPGYVYLALLLFTLCIYLPAFWTRVPYYPTPRPAYPCIVAELPIDREFTLIDIGSGFGEMLIFLAKQRPNGHFTGIEIGIFPFLISFLRAKIERLPNVRFAYRSMWKTELAPFTYVYAFLSPAPMERLWAKACSEMRPGSLFISNSFAAPADPSAVIPIKDERKSSLYVYRMP
jgi:hypothetical protein